MSPLRTSRATAVALVTLATFTDITAYSIAVPVLPDLSRRLGASPTVIGLLFASFGVTLLTVSIPIGAVSDRIGRKPPIVGGLAALAAATLLFAFARGLPLLFAARLVQGAADAITWVVGFALIADLYEPDERGRVSGIVMSGASLAFMLGPSLGGWLYELGGIRLPFLAVAALSGVAAAGFAWLQPPTRRAPRDPVPLRVVVRTPTIAACAATVVGVSATVSMLEPVLALHAQTFGVGPARIGLIFGAGAVASTILNPLFGRAADRWGARRLMTLGVVATACATALVGQAWSYASVLGFFTLTAASAALVITPSLSYMGEAASGAGFASFGVAYGIYNMAWGAGLLGGPAAGGFLYEQIGFPRVALLWAAALAVLAAVDARLSRATSFRSVPIPRP